MKTSFVNLIALACITCGMPGATAAEGPSKGVAEQQLQRSEYRQTLDTIMHEEKRDNPWAVEMETTLHRSLYAFAKMDRTVVELSCAKTLCRVVLDHKTPQGQQDVLMELTGAPGFDLAGKAHLEVSANGAARSYVYLLRSEDDAWPLASELIR